MRTLSLTSKASTDLAGYVQAVDALVDQRKDWRKYGTLMAEEDFAGVRHALDEKGADFYMSRPMVQFYLGISPGTFRRLLNKGPHPFPPRKGATKGEVDAWFNKLHLEEVGSAGEEVTRWGRNLKTGRPYLVTNRGVILTDAQVAHLPPEDVEVWLKNGADIRVMHLETALGKEWADPAVRKVWAGVRMRLLNEELAAVEAAISRAHHQDMEAELGAGEGVRSVPRGRL